MGDLEITELKLLAAIAAGGALQLLQTGQYRFRYLIEETEPRFRSSWIKSDQLEKAAASLNDKGLIYFKLDVLKTDAEGALSNWYALPTAEGRRQLIGLRFEGAAPEEIDDGLPIKAGPAFICMLCGMADEDRDSVAAHIETDHDDNHSDDDGGDDQDDYRPGGYYDQMDSPRNAGEPNDNL